MFVHKLLSFARQNAIKLHKAASLLMVVSMVISAFLIGYPSQPVQAATPAGFSEYYIPGSADQLSGILYDLDPFFTATPPFSLTNVITISVGADNTVIKYDHWEKGYGNAVETYTANRGSVLTFKSTNLPSTGVTSTTTCPGSTNPNGTTTACYDGRDHITVTGGTVSVAQVFWPTLADTLFASAWEIYPVKPYQTSYILPVGEDLYQAAGSYSDFQKVYVIAQALSDSTNVQINDPTTPGVDVTATLNKGEVTQLWHTHVGTTITSNKPVQVQFIIGNNSTHYNSRSFTAVPSGLWSAKYFSPVPGAANGNTDLFIFNPNPTSMNVNYQDTTGGGSFQIPANSTVSYQAKVGRYIPQNSGVSLAASDGVTTFWAIGSADAGSANYNWGFSLIPANLLTTEYYFSWSPGSSNLTTTTNGSPVYVSPTQDNTTVFVDYSPVDGVVDATYTLNRLQVQKLFDPDKDNTGTHIWATAPIAVVWGEDPDSAPAGAPGIDAGYTILPFNQNWIELVSTLNKTASPSSIAPLAGQVSTFTIVINVGAYGLNNLYVTDVLPANWAYVPGSTSITWPGGSSTANPSGTPGPNLSWGSAGSPIASLAANQTMTVVYQAQTTAVPGNYNLNTATSTGAYNGNTYSATGSTIVVTTPPDLSVVKTNNVAGSVLTGSPFTWNLQVLNGSSSGLATFTTGQVLLRDYLPTGPVYGSPTVTAGAIPPGGTGTIQCSIASSVLTCSASGGTVILPTGSTFNVAFTATSAAAGTLVNPTGGSCLVDPNGVITESNETNNSCADTVTVVAPATITGLVYNDLNGNGVFDSGEPGISGVTLTLSTGATATTNSSGAYTFSNLLAGAYSVTETDLGGYTSTGDTQGANDNVVGNITLAAGATSSGNNFFDWQPATISGKVYNDLDGSGNYTTGDVGLSGVTVTLKNSGGTVIATATTDANGAYTFGSLPAGTYSVTETDPPNFGSTGDTQGANDNIVGNITVTAGQTSTGNNFFDWQRATITGTVYNDKNGSGTFNAGEPGISGVTVTLKNSGGAVVATAATDSSGAYSFGNLAGGAYSVTETDPAGYVSTGDTQGANDNVVGGIAAVVGTTSSGNNFFDWQRATITGTVYYDVNGNGSYDAGDTGIAGVTVKLSTNATTTTDANGFYSFGNLAAGNYTVTETNLPGYTSSGDTQGVNDDKIQNIVAVVGATTPNNNFFDWKPATISGMVYKDVLGNGVYDSGDTGINGVTLTLKDSGGAVVKTTTTNNGAYSFTNLAPGTYSVTETDPAGYVSTGDTQGANDNIVGNITVAAGDTSTGNNFFDWQCATITGTVYNDLDDSANFSAGDVGISGVTLTLKNNGGTVLATTTTDSSGNYIFTNQPAGTFSVTETDPAGFTSTTTNVLSNISVNAGQTKSGNNFFDWQPATITGGVYNDLNGNGAFDAGEPGISGVTVKLSTNATTTTDGNGLYSFTSLVPGTYSVTETDKNGYTSTGDTATQGARTDNIVGSITVTPGQTSAGNNFFDTTYGVITGTVYNDLDDSAGLTAGDTGISGVTVTLKNSVGTVLATTATDANGVYIFTNLATANGLSVTETDPAGFTSTTANVLSGINVTAGNTVSGKNFFDWQPATITGGVYNDLNGNGAFDAGEPGISGVTVKLKDSGGTVVNTVTTDANGLYSFTNLVAGAYSVTETDKNGYTSTGDTQGLNDNVVGNITLTPGQTSAGNNFFDTTYGVITGTVYNDLDDSANLSVGDIGISGVTVTLKNSVGTVLATTTTDANGGDIFTNLAAANGLSVTETDPAGFTSTTTNVLSGINVTAGNTVSGKNFFDWQPATITGGVYNDLNGNGAFDGGEPGISGVTVKLSTNATTTTDANGLYSFTNLVAGAYSVTETDKNGYTSTGDTQGARTDNIVGNITLVPGQTSAGNNFFDTTLGVITGTVYNDLDDSGNLTAGDTGISGVTLTLKNSGGTVLTTTTTDASGFYIFTNLAAANGLSVTETDLPGYVSTGDVQNPNDNIVGGINVTAGQTKATNDFFDWQRVTITGNVYNDQNGNGSYNAGEPGISSVTVQLKNSLGAVVATTTTDANGAYTFSNLPADTYSVTETDPSGFVSTGDTEGANDNVVGNIVGVVGVISSGNNFFDWQPATISGTVYNDVNGSGTYNAGDTGLSGVTVTLKDSGGTVVASATTDSNGAYTFANLPAGTYSVTETDPSGYFSTGDTQGANDNIVGSITVAAGATSAGNNFFDWLPAITGNVYNDLNGNGSFNTGEPGISGVTLTLKNNGGTTVATTTTDSNGFYLFGNLAAGTYSVTETDPSGFVSTGDTQGSLTDNVVGNIAVVSGSTSTGNNFFDWQPATISGTVYNDADDSSGFTAGETGISGVTLTLKDNLGAVVTTATTNGSGGYTFNNLPAGTYSVTETDPSGYVSTGDTQGANDNVVGSITVAAGATNAGNNFFDWQPATISGTVYNDLNGNGSYDAGDTGLSGVTVKLSTNATTTTDANGAYTFNNLVAGAYSVTETDPSGYVSTSSNVLGSITIAEGATSSGNNFFDWQPVADLDVTKDDGKVVVNSTSSTTYTLTLVNHGPGAANNSTLSDPAAAGLSKTGIGTCTASGGAVCPSPGSGAGQLSIANLEAGTVVVPTLPNSGSLYFSVTALVTASQGAAVTNTFTATPPPGTTDPTPATASDTDHVNTPTAVDLLSFKAVPLTAYSVVVKWVPASEIDTSGYNLYRSQSANGPWIKVNADLIMVHAPGSASGSEYSFTDTGILPRVQYYYRVEAIDSSLAPHDYGVLGYEGFPAFVPLIISSHH